MFQQHTRRNIWDLTTIIFIVSCLFTHGANAAEFANLLSYKVIHSKDAGNGRAISFSTGGFGLLAGMELKTFQHKSYGSLNVGMLYGKANFELGLNEHGPTFRGAMAFPIIPHADFLGASRLDLSIGYEINHGESDFNGPFLGINVFFFI